MENIIVFLNNPIVSGIIVFVVTYPIGNIISRFFGKRRHRKNIKDANKKIVSLTMDYLLSVKDIENFSRMIVMRIRQAVSIDLEVKSEELYSFDEIISIIITESLEIRMFPEDFRKKMFDHFSEIDTLLKGTEDDSRDSYSSNSTRTLSIAISAMLTMLLFMVIIIYSSMDPDKRIEIVDPNLGPSFEAVFGALAALIASSSLLIIMIDKKNPASRTIDLISRMVSKFVSKTADYINRFFFR